MALQNKKNILELINFVSRTKNIDRKIIIDFLKNSIQRIVNSQLDPDAEITLEIKDDELILMNLKKMVISDEEEYKNDSEIVDIPKYFFYFVKPFYLSFLNFAVVFIKEISFLSIFNFCFLPLLLIFITISLILFSIKYPSHSILFK